MKFLTALIVLLAAQTPASGTPDPAAMLLQNDKLLLTAVHRGDRTTWEKLTTPDFAYVEEGVIQSRSAFLESLEEDGLQPLVIREHAVHLIGDTAIVVHRDEIPPSAANARPGGRYLMTETWQRIEQVWKLRLVHVEAIRSDPPAIALSQAQIDDLVGVYRATGGAYRIRRDGLRILGSHSGRPEKELLAETRDVLFVHGETRVRRVFRRDPASGVVTGFVVRDENSDFLYTRVSADDPPASRPAAGSSRGSGR